MVGDSILRSCGFSQQVFIETRELKRQGYEVFVLAFCHIKYFLNKVLIEKVREQYRKEGINICIVPTFLFGKLLLEVLYLPVAWALLSYLIVFKRVKIFHVHSKIYTLMLLPLKFVMPIRIINDNHGVTIEEGIYRDEIKSGSILYHYANFKEKLAMKYANFNLCVSQKMIDYYTNKHTLSLSHFTITRSSFDPDIFKYFSYDQKEQAKKLLGLHDKKVLLYMGHKQSWQQISEIVELYAEFKKYIPHLFIIFLTNDIVGVRENFQRIKVPDSEYMVKYVAHEEVPLYSYSADVAIIMRSDSIVNHVSSPVKFSEYLASGASVLISPTIGDLPSLVKKYNIGVVLSSDGMDSAISYFNDVFESKERQKLSAEKCREVAEKEFSVKNTIDIFKKCYEKIT